MSESQANACTAFNILVQDAFPDSMVNARTVKLLGEDCIVVTFTGSKTYQNNIPENDPAFMKFLVHVNKDGTAEVESPTTHSNAVWRNGVKFRKTKAGSEAELMQKLAQWFIKNHDGILSASHQK